MINLLPPKEKETLIQEENWKLVSILGIVIISALFSLLLILFSIEIKIASQAESQKILLIQEQKKIETTEMKELQEKISLANRTFSNLNSFYQGQIYFTEILERISKTLPPKTYLTNLSITPLNEKELDIRLSGFSPTWEILLEFKENLEKETTIKEIYFPPSIWIKPTDINFNITFKITLR